MTAESFSSFAQEEFGYLTTTGRVSGQPRTIEIWFAINGATIYMMSGARESSNWVKNALRTPRVLIKIKNRSFSAQARRAADDAEDALARTLLLAKYKTPENPLLNWGQTALPIAFDVT